MKPRRVLSAAYLIICFMLLCTITANAYIDPATTSYIIQIVAGLLISLGVIFATMSAKIKAFVINFRVNMLRRKVAREAKKSPQYKAALQKNAATSAPGIQMGRWQFLWSDSRPFRQRLLLASIVCFSFVFTFFIFGTYDLFINNSEQFDFLFADIWLPLLLSALAVFIILGALLLILRGRLFDFALTFLFGILIAGYLQGNFFNLRLGQMTGDLIVWKKYLGHSLLNTLLWTGILAIPFLVRMAGRKIWRPVLIFVSVLLIVMQSIGFVSSAISSNAFSHKRSVRYLSTKGMYNVSNSNNIFIIILDRLDQKFIKNMLKEDPNFYDNLDGFTQFMNNTSYYCRSFPSAIHMLTGAVSFYETPADEFFEKAWRESTFISDLRANGYTTKFYMSQPYLYTDIKQIDGIADNIADGKITIDSFEAIKDFTILSAFRYAPHALKANFHISTLAFDDIVTSTELVSPYKTNDARFFKDLKELKLSKSEKKKNFVYYHLNGMHDYILNEDAEPAGDTTSELVQMRACFTIVNEFLSQLKELGLYESSTIVITGDHGQSTDRWNLEAPVLTGLFVKLPGSAGTPLVRSNAPVSQDMLRATLIKAAGIETDKYGPTYFDIPENADIVRPFYYRVDKWGERHYLEEFEIRGDANDFSNWHKISEIPIKYRHG